MLSQRRFNLLQVTADFDGVRQRVFERLPVWRRCPKCHRAILIARCFGDPRNRFWMRATHGGGRGHRHAVRDGFRAWLERDWGERMLALWYLAERPTLVTLRRR